MGDPSLRTIVAATGNAHKLEELRALLPGVRLLGLGDFEPMPEPEETAETYAGNALIKAFAAHRRCGLPTLADDSGLEVDALFGAPGVRSARFVPGSDADRRRALLLALEGAPSRTARFVCVIALVGLNKADHGGPDVEWSRSESGQALLVRGVCEGRLTTTERGFGGFGYDPIFELIDLGSTFAELPSATKHRYSHRGLAAAVLGRFLETLDASTQPR